MGHSQAFPFHVPPWRQITSVGVDGVGVLIVITVDELVDELVERVGTVMAIVALCELGFVPAVAVERVVVVTTSGVTEVEEAEVVVGLEWPEVDIGEVVSDAIVENVLASEGLVTGEVVAKVDVAVVLA